MDISDSSVFFYSVPYVLKRTLLQILAKLTVSTLCNRALNFFFGLRFFEKGSIKIQVIIIFNNIIFISSSISIKSLPLGFNIEVQC